MKLQSFQVKILFMCSFLYELNSLMCLAEETLMETEIDLSFLRVYNLNPFDDGSESNNDDSSTASTAKSPSTSTTEKGSTLTTRSTESSPATTITVLSSPSTTEFVSRSTTGDTESPPDSTTDEITESTTGVETTLESTTTTTTTTTTTRAPTTTTSSTTPKTTPPTTTTTTTTKKTTTKSQSSIPYDDEPSAFNIAPLIVLPIVTIILLIGVGYYMMNHVKNQYVSYDRGCLFKINRCCTSTASEFSILDELSLSEVSNSRKSSLGSNYTI